ncbi:MAG TPA: hypothetical protein EYG54_06855 [Myxococcales bacterium]|nr:hypothetical protein [Myxococcales bacterium]
MRKSIGRVVVGFMISLSLVAAGNAQAGNTNTNSEGVINALDANRGTGVQVNADKWENMDNVLAGDGSQTQDTMRNANTGSGTQDNSLSSASGWSGSSDGSSVNNGSGSQLGGSTNSNGGDRNSNDIVIGGGDDTAVASAALEASVTGNAVSILELNATVDSSMTFDNMSGFKDMAGVSAVAMAAGSNASQNVNVQVTADVVGGSIH